MTDRVKRSLFNRLIDLDTHSNQATAAMNPLTRESLEASLHQELSWLLNTTCSFSREAMESLERNTLTYGIHDFSGFFPDSSENRKRLSNMIREIIDAFEPRLESIAVKVNEMNTKDDRFSLALVIKAALIVNKTSEPVTFVMAIN